MKDNIVLNLNNLERKVIQDSAKKILKRTLTKEEIIKFIGKKQWLVYGKTSGNVLKEYQFFSNGKQFDITNPKQVLIEMKTMYNRGVFNNVDEGILEFIKIARKRKNNKIFRNKFRINRDNPKAIPLFDSNDIKREKNG